MANAALGGAACGLQKAAGLGVGINTVGLVVRTTGKVTQVLNNNEVYISDGTANPVSVINISGLTRGDYVVVEGIIRPYASAGLKRVQIHSYKTEIIKHAE